jgi:hypothetical protein
MKNFKIGFLRYLNDEWNFCDFFGCLLFFIGFFLRIYSKVPNGSMFVAGRYKCSITKIKLSLLF